MHARTALALSASAALYKCAEALQPSVANRRVSATANLQWLSNTRLFTVSQDGTSLKRTAPAVERDMSPFQFYDKRDGSGHTGFEAVEQSTVYLYRDVRDPSDLSLFWLHGMDSKAQKRAYVYTHITSTAKTPKDLGMRLVEADDKKNKEFGWTAQSETWFKSNWAGLGKNDARINMCEIDDGKNAKYPTEGAPCSSPANNYKHFMGSHWLKEDTDGGAIQDIPVTNNCNWEMHLNLRSAIANRDTCSNKPCINKWRMYFGDGTSVNLDMSKTLKIKGPACSTPGSCSTGADLATTTTTSGQYCAVAQKSGTIKYTFNWGDGTSSTVSKASGTQACASHTYSSAGKYTVQVTATAGGQSITKCLSTVTVTCTSNCGTPYPTGYPTGYPVNPPPTTSPTGFPTGYPSGFPTGYPTGFPTGYPSGFPTGYPSGFPTGYPSGFPTGYPIPPTSPPTGFPTGYPSGFPTGYPTGYPIPPSSSPTSYPSGYPSPRPSSSPTTYPTADLWDLPQCRQGETGWCVIPGKQVTKAACEGREDTHGDVKWVAASGPPGWTLGSGTVTGVCVWTYKPWMNEEGCTEHALDPKYWLPCPTSSPTGYPTGYPTASPTTARPTTARPTTASPTTARPTTAPPTTTRPTEATGAPTEATGAPTDATGAPTEATGAPTDATGAPTEATGAPTDATGAPTEATGAPTDATGAPTEATGAPTDATGAPTEATGAPTEATGVPTVTEDGKETAPPILKFDTGAPTEATGAPTVTEDGKTTAPPTLQFGGQNTGMEGDPIVLYDGKKTQFWTTPGQSSELLLCGEWGVHGRAFNGAERSQWFRSFEVRHMGKALAEVSVSADVSRAQAHAASSAVEAAEEIDVTVETAVRGAERAAAVPENKTLPSTLIVVAEGRQLGSTGDRMSAQHGLNVSIAYGREYAGFRYHTAMFDTKDLSFTISSAPAGKMKSSADSVKYTHLDLKFTNIHANECSGVLPEIWGVKPMTSATAKMLVPPE